MIVGLRFDKPSHLYQLDEEVTGKLLVNSPEAFKAIEVGIKLFFIADGERKFIDRLTIAREVEIENSNNNSFDFSFANHEFQSYGELGFNCSIEVEGYVQRGLGIKIASLFDSKRRAQELTFASDLPYTIPDEEVRLTSSVMPLLLLLPILIIASVTFSISTYLGSALILIAILGFLYWLLGLQIGKMRFKIVPIDGESFNVVLDSRSKAIWSTVKEASIHYEVVGQVRKDGSRSRGMVPAKQVKTFLLHASNRMQVNPSTGMWAKFQFPNPPSVPASNNRFEGVSINWKLKVEVRSKLGLHYDYSGTFVTMRQGGDAASKV